MINNDKIVKIDRTTMQEFLPVFMNKGIFTNYNDIPEKESILESARQSLGTDQLTTEQEREALTKAGRYRSGNYVVRDYGTYAIAFSAKLYLDDILAESITKDILETVTEEVKISKALDRLKLYTLGHKLAIILLAEAYQQRTHKNLRIEKAKILEYLGVAPTEKHIYESISDAMFSLCYVNYRRYEYKNKTNLPKGKSLGLFVYNVDEDAKAYTVSINENFLGCVAHLLEDEKPSEKRKVLFKRGYFDFPVKILPMTRNYSPAAYLLTNFLISDSGNKKLGSGTEKVVCYQMQRYLYEANIRSKRVNEQIRILLSALREIEIIDRTEPALSELQQMKPSKAAEKQLRVYVRQEKVRLDMQNEG